MAESSIHGSLKTDLLFKALSQMRFSSQRFSLPIRNKFFVLTVVCVNLVYQFEVQFTESFNTFPITFADY